MGSTSFSPTIITKKFLPLIPQAINLQKYPNRTAFFSNNVTSYKPRTKNKLYSEQRGCSMVAFGVGNSDSKEEDKRALETVLKLYDAIKNKDIEQMTDIIGEECRCVCNFVSASKPFVGKKQVLGFYCNLMQNLGKNIEFVVQPTLHEGMTVAVSWKLEWKKSANMPLGKGFGFYMCHVYHGKVVIRNVEMFMEPLLHIEPLRLKLIGYLMNAMDKMSIEAEYKEKVEKGVYLLFAFFFVAAQVVFIRTCLAILNHLIRSRK